MKITWFVRCCTLAMLAVSAATTTIYAWSADLSEVSSGHYVLDKNHGYINLQYNHMGFSNPMLHFRDFSVDLDLDKEHPAQSHLNVVVKASSADSGVPLLDEHLSGAGFFDAEKFPEITFVSKNIQMTAPDHAVVTGDLTIKGITKPVTLNVTLNKAAPNPMTKLPALGFSATTTLKRSDWGVSKYVPMVSDQVNADIEVELHQGKP